MGDIRTNLLLDEESHRMMKLLLGKGSSYARWAFRHHRIIEILMKAQESGNLSAIQVEKIKRLL